MSPPGRRKGECRSAQREGTPTSAQPIVAEARRLEELSLNASGAFQSLVYDGWLLGYRPGPTKRLRCVNAFYSTSLPLAEKVEYCARFYQSVGLPIIFRMLPFSQPPELDSYLQSLGWSRFERTLVLRAELPATPDISAASDAVEIIDVPKWVESTAVVLDRAADTLSAAVERARSYPLPHAGAIIRHRGEVVACGLVKIEGAHAGLFAVNTAPAHRRRGFGFAIVSALLGEAKRQGSRLAYLQVTAENDAALALYRPFGFAPVYDYWYRGPDQ
ncbi:MAG: GNAT family N-acetyltransferase [Pseudomonadota bacterium]|nr:GNAT family N-acetyltransferase [Pseudomonadota bacterium]